MGCRPPNLEAVAQAVFALQHFSIFAKLIIADFEKMPGKALLRSGGVPCVRILLLRVSGTLWNKPVTGGLKEVFNAGLFKKL